MQILRVLAVAGVAAGAYGQVVARPEIVDVRSVIDGHTVEVAGGGRIRLAGIRAPRPPRGAAGGEPFGEEARRRLEGIVTHRFVRLERPTAGARAAYVLLEDGTFVNALLVSEGLARVAGRTAGPRGEELSRAQASARAARRGVWGAR
jgi:micrococcal nuclease